MNFSNLFTAFILIVAAIVFILLVGPLALRGWVYMRVRSRVYGLGQAVPSTDAAIILGAALWADGSPTPVLYDRVSTGVELYRSGRVKILLMSGDGRSESYNEPDAMRKLAIEMGVPADKILVDYAGLRTYESLLRARRFYNLDHVTIVTQGFHMDRALYLAGAARLNAVGVTADRRRYRFLALQRSRLREVIATVRAWLDIQLSRWMTDPVDDPTKDTSL